MNRSYGYMAAAFMLCCCAAFGIPDRTPLYRGGAETAHVRWENRFHVKTGSMPKAVVITPDGREAWVTNFGHLGRHSVTVFDAQSGSRIKDIDLPGRAVELAFSRDGTKAFVSNFDDGTLEVIDTGTYSIQQSIPVGANPKIVTLSPSGDRAYVSNWSSDDISVVDTSALQSLGRINVGKNPRGSWCDPSGRLLFVANFNGRSVSVVNTNSKEVLATIPAEENPRHVAAAPDGSLVFVSNFGSSSDKLAVIDPQKFEIQRWIKVGKGPKSICVAPDSRFIFSADYRGNTVSIVDIMQDGLIASIPDVGESPSGLALSPDGSILYVTSWYSNDLWAFNLSFQLSPVSEKDTVQKGSSR